MTGAEIIAKTGYPRSFVYKQIAKAKKGEPVHDKPRRGGPKKISDKVRKSVLKLCKGKEGMSTRKVAAILNGRNVDISHESVRSILRGSGLKSLRPVPKPMLTKEHMARRLAFAQLHLHRDWSKTLFTDEKHFLFHAPPNRKNDVVWDEAGVRHVYLKVAHPVQVRVWGGFSARGKTQLVRYTHNPNSEGYMKIIEGQATTIKAMFEDRPFQFQQDGAPAHTSATTLRFLRQTFGQPFHKNQWPANSPDLNPIENLWAIIQAKVRARNPTSVQSLKSMITMEWNKISGTVLENLVNSMGARLRQCIARNGGYIDY